MASDDVPILWSSRMLVTFMCFWGITIVIFLRYNMSMAIVCMVNHTAVNAQNLHLQDLADNGHQDLSNMTRVGYVTSAEVNVLVNSMNNQTLRRSACGTSSNEQTTEDTEDGPLLWSKDTQGLVLSAYFWGYVGLQLVSGWVVGRVGSRYTLGLSILAASVACVFIPVTAMHSAVGTMVLRVFIGFVSGVSAPAVHNLLSNWAPAKEISTLGSWAYAGYSVGGLGANAISGLLCKYGFAGGWPSVFYVFGGIGIIFSIAWFLLIRERPTEHKRISIAERDYILRNIEDHESKQKSLKMPLGKILTSMPVYAIIVSGFTVDFSGMLFYLYIPLYLSEVMFFDVSSNGLTASLPFIFQFILQIVTGSIADAVVQRTQLSISIARKLFDAVGKIICIISLVAIGFVDCSQPVVAVVLIIISLSSIGIQNCGYYVNPLDIAPPYSGFIIALANTFGAFCGFITPPIVGAITGSNPSRETWQIVFLVSAGVVAFGCIFYTIFASGNIQPWAQADLKIPKVMEIHLEDNGLLLDKTDFGSNRRESQTEKVENGGRRDMSKSLLIQKTSGSPVESVQMRRE
ncbi:uncharacterized transporter slc-17.2 [Aplysia californica]|uniref:Uncharacterized transporter slc-17.2 n=1 Tax=Aplysia californica TaxID=6500 RepID=A0ABM1A817_APLCA|nr:uncharacterized transporter slc-17.2 [Aplysia californica]